MTTKCCAACGRPFQPHSRIPDQAYCSDPPCQRERRRRWQQAKRQSDPDYRDNQKRAQQAWAERNSDYWRVYRSEHPDYVERNRTLQHKRNASREPGPIAKKDAIPPGVVPPSGIYQLRVLSVSSDPGKKVWIVEIAMLTDSTE